MIHKLSLAIYFIINGIFSPNICQSQSIISYSGKVLSFNNYNKQTETVTPIDTVTGQYRAVSIDTTNKKIVISWQIANDTTIMDYSIETIYITENNNSNNNKTLNLVSFDKDNFPLLILTTLNNDAYLYFYYYWDSTTKSFKKTEQIKVTSHKTIDYSIKK